MNSTDTTTMITIDEFIKKHDLRMDYLTVSRRPRMGDWAKGSSHYKITLSIGESLDSMEFYYSMGPALKGKPELSDILDCLSSDASGIDGAMNFEGWADELGFDPDSRKAEVAYNQSVEQTEELKRILGHKAYQELLYSTERL